MINQSRVNMLLPYMGYYAYNRIYLKGRIINRRMVIEQQNPSIWRNLKNNIHRFSTVKYGSVHVTLNYNNTEIHTYTDSEGYFVFDQVIIGQNPDLSYWSTGVIKIKDSKIGEIETEARIMNISPQDKRAIICDIDDTIMESHVSSWLKLKMLFYSFTRSAIQRDPVEYMSKFLNVIFNAGSYRRPIFYVSNSPWNIYDFIVKFISHHGFPEGPIFLRDYGIQLIKRKKTDPIHKIETIGKLFNTLSDYTFVLIGDSSERDIDHYIDIYCRYPSRVDGIFLRDVGNETKRELIQEKIIKINAEILISFSNDVNKFIQDAQKLNWDKNHL